ncbi:hypothetical protein ACIPSA_17955 [Streptomyces sp. NPDC086549]|uniref:hypothetical protein n=1 Tax=Streptomyces sp. NPDC086549 TaxID=3365752 RepID=UPI003801B227
MSTKPAVDVSLPHIVRIAQGKDTWLYFQPTLSTRVKTERGQEPLRTSFCVAVSEAAAAIMRSAQQYTFHDFRNDVPSSDARKTGCYPLSPV